MREFDGGASRDSDQGKIDPDGYLSPEVLEQFFLYMQKHQTCCDGSQRSSDNWKSGIPSEVYIKSLWRHFFEAWMIYRGREKRTPEEMVDSLCAILFNVQGLMYEVLKGEERDGTGELRLPETEVK